MTKKGSSKPTKTSASSTSDTKTQHCTVRRMAHQIKEAFKSKEPVERPHFAVFLGAGASVESGVKAVGGMIAHFKKKIIESEAPSDSITGQDALGWINQQDWWKSTVTEYSQLFERAYPKERDRQLYIERLIEGRTPSFGYVVLANLMARNYINTVITTNFDDLVYNACTTFTEMRPVVYAYGGFASELQISTPRAKVLKLHGDYLYTSLKNTGQELSEQDPNMARQVRHILDEYGVIVIGYNGGDASIMETLEQIPKTNALYWCHYIKGEPLSGRAKQLLQDKEGFLVEIDGFDSMMKEIGQIIGFDGKQMIEAIEKRKTYIIDEIKKLDPEYSATILGEMAESLQEEETPEKERQRRDRAKALEHFSKGQAAFRARDFHTAELEFRKAIELNPMDIRAYNNLAALLLEQERTSEAEENIKAALNINPNDVVSHIGLGMTLLTQQNFTGAEENLHKAIELDPKYVGSYLRLGTIFLAQQRYEEAERIVRKGLELNPMESGVYSLLGGIFLEQKHFVEAESAFRKSIEVNPKIANDYHHLTKLLRRLNRQDEAFILAERALLVCNEHPLKYLSLIPFYRMRGDDLAVKELADKIRNLLLPKDVYILACLEAILGNKEEALLALKAAITKIPARVVMARQDIDFETLQEDSRFIEIVGGTS
jgi:tetratricopeptide (TPR) repeat protein